MIFLKTTDVNFMKYNFFDYRMYQENSFLNERKFYRLFNRIIYLKLCNLKKPDKTQILHF